MTAAPPPRPRAPRSRGEPLLSRIAGRAVLAITVLAIVSAACGAVALAASTETLSVPASSGPDPGRATGRTFEDPPAADVAAGAEGALTITLDAADMRYDLGSGKWAWGQAYDGSSTVPTLRVVPGTQVSVRVVNHLPMAARVRFHGLRVGAAAVNAETASGLSGLSAVDALGGPSGGPSGLTAPVVKPRSGRDSVCVAAGATAAFSLTIPANHPQGTYWYRSNILSTPCPTATVAGGLPGKSPPGLADAQPHAGLSGALIVGDDRTLLPTPYRDIAAHTFVLQDPPGSDCLVNGQLRPVLPIRPNETQLWRFINADMGLTYRLRLDGYRFAVVDEDGAPIAAATTADTLLLPPGKRYDVLVTANDHDGDTWLRTTAAGADEPAGRYAETELVRLAVEGRMMTRLPELGLGE